jgi:hypothetical protein
MPAHVAAMIFAIPALVILYLLGNPFTHSEQREWECRPAPGYCDIDTDFRSQP